MSTETNKTLKTLSLNFPLTLMEALQWIEDGRCLGIKPQNNLKHMVVVRPERGMPRLVWEGTSDGTMWPEQIRGEWFPVIVDHRSL